MTKWLLLAVVVVVVLWLLGRNRRPSDRQADRGSNRGADRATGAGGAGLAAAKAPPAGAAPEPEPMVDCAHCGVLLPRSDALAADAPYPGTGPAAMPSDGLRYFCCEAHRRAGPGRS